MCITYVHCSFYPVDGTTGSHLFLRKLFNCFLACKQSLVTTSILHLLTHSNHTSKKGVLPYFCLISSCLSCISVLLLGKKHKDKVLDNREHWPPSRLQCLIPGLRINKSTAVIHGYFKFQITLLNKAKENSSFGLCRY